MTSGLRAACGRAIHVFAVDGRLLSGGRAALFLLERVGWPRSARLLARPPLVWGVEFAYRLVALNRDRLARVCMRDESLESAAQLQRAEAIELREQLLACWCDRERDAL